MCLHNIRIVVAIVLCTGVAIFLCNVYQLEALQTNCICNEDKQPVVEKAAPVIDKPPTVNKAAPVVWVLANDVSRYTYNISVLTMDMLHVKGSRKLYRNVI